MIKINKLIRKPTHEENFIYKIIRLVSLASFFSIFSSVILIKLFQSNEYPIDETIIFRLFFAGYLVGLVVLNKIIDRYNIIDHFKELNQKSFFANLVISACAIFSYQQFFYGILTTLELTSCFLIIAFLSISNIEFKLLKTTALRNLTSNFYLIISYLLIFIVLLLTLLDDKYLGPESSFDIAHKIINENQSDIEKIDSYQNNYLIKEKQIDVSKDSFNQFSDNFELYKLINNLLELDIKKIKFLSSNKLLSGNLNLTNIQYLCFFSEESNSISEQLDTISVSPWGNSISTCVNKVIKFNKLDVEINNSFSFIKEFMINHNMRPDTTIFNELSQIFSNDNVAYKDASSYENRNDDARLLSISLIRGGYFHHYNSIAQTLSSSNHDLDFFKNQYGFGPLFLTNLLVQKFKLPKFDAIFIITFLLNIIFLFVALGFIGLKNIIALNGYSLSLLSIYAFSQFMAPFLFPIRYFPIIIICLIIYKFIMKNEHYLSRNYKIIFYILLLITAFYNFEYAILLSFSLIFGGLFIKNKFFIYSGLFTIILSLIPKILLTDANNEIYVNYYAYISGVGRGSIMDLFTISFFLVSGALLAMIFKNREKINQNIFILIFIFFFLSLKVVWIGSFNHIGGLFFILSLIYGAYYSFSIKSKSNLIQSEIYFFNKLAVVYFLVILFLSFYNLTHINLNNKMRNMKYDYKPTLSKIFQIEKNYINKINSFEKIYKKGELVISPIDNTLALAVGSKLTGPYPDLTTNLNITKDVFVSMQYYKNSKRNIIVDKSIFSIRALGSKNIIYDNVQFEDYNRNNFYFLKVYNSLLNSKNYFECQQNEYFIKLCLMN